MDYLATDTNVDSRRVFIIGHSRGGKTALWAAAEDQRFRFAVSNDSGHSGAKLVRHKGTKTIKTVNAQFPHWFANNYRKFNDRESSLPVDQHELLSLLAPRHYYVASAQLDKDSDPKGEFLSQFGAVGVYKLFGLDDNRLIPANWPPTLNRTFRGEAMGYHIRTGGHDLLKADWQLFSDYAQSIRPSN